MRARAVRVQHRRHQRKLVLGGVGGQLVDRRVADAALGLVDDAAERDVVVRIDQRAHVGDQILDLLALVELLAAVDAIRHAAAHERLFQHARLRVGAVQHGDLAGPVAVGDQLARHRGHERRLVALIQRVVQRDALALARLGPQRLLLAPAVVGDDLVGRVEDVAGGAVVLLELDDLRLGEVLLKVEDVPDVRAAPAVDRLVVVADDAEVVLLPRQQADELVLRGVGVLIFVHQNVLKPPLVILEHRRILGEQFQRPDEQVVEVQRVVAAQRLFVLLVDLEVAAVARVAPGVGEPLLRREHPVFRIRDDRAHSARRILLVAQIERLQDGLDDRHAVVGVVDGELPLVAELFDVAAEDARATGVERRDPRLVAGLAGQLLHALRHLARGLVGKRDGQDLPRGHALFHQVRHAVGQHAGLAAAGAGEHEQRSLRALHGGPLRRVEPGQIDHEFSSSFGFSRSSTRS